MARPIVSVIAIVAAVCGGGCGPVGQQPVQLEVKRADKEEKSRPKKKSMKEIAAEQMAARVEPLVLERWPMPPGQKAPDKKAGVMILINPRGPQVVTQSKAEAVTWDARTGTSRPRKPVEGPELIVEATTGPNGRLLCLIRERKSGDIRLELKERPTRLACWAPDGERMIVVGDPSVYRAYQTINIATGESRVHPERPVKNVSLFDLTTGKQLGAFAPKDYQLDDDIWAAAVAMDGASLFLATKDELLRVSFEVAFGVAPLPPLGR